MTRQALLDLAARCEAATGADRELDLLIHRAVKALPDDWPICTGNSMWSGGRYTASLDAAMTLVPEGCDWLFNSRSNYAQVWERKGVGDQMWECKSAATPALALTAACLRALAQEIEP